MLSVIMELGIVQSKFEQLDRGQGYPIQVLGEREPG